MCWRRGCPTNQFIAHRRPNRRARALPQARGVAGGRLARYPELPSTFEGSREPPTVRDPLQSECKTLFSVDQQP